MTAIDDALKKQADGSSARADVSILIVTWNSASWIGRCLDSIPLACGRISHEIVVYDNASSDRTLSVLKEFVWPGLKTVAGSVNVGFAGGVNRALHEARGRYLLLLNPDCELSAGSVERLIDYLDARPKVAAAVPLLLDEGGAPQREFQLRRFPTMWSVVLENLLMDKLFERNPISASYRYRDLDITRPQPVEQPAAAAMLLRSEAARQVGDLDERFAPAWFEDVDYCQRLRLGGGVIHLVPEATAVHHRGSSLLQLTHARFVEIWYENLYRYARKWMREGEAELVRWSVILGMVLRMAAVLIGFDPVRLRRGEAMGVYRRVLRGAFHRWDDRSPQS